MNSELKKIATIITRNFWQMDGLTYTVPNTDIECKIYNWRSKKNMKLVGEGNMKFDFVIGNPPYQERDGGAQASARPLYHKFIEESKKIGKTQILIVPSRWMTGGRGLDEFRNTMINDKSVKILHDYVNADDCFNDVEIKGGVCYFLRDENYNGKCQIFRHIPEGVRVSERYLVEDGDTIFIREDRLIPIKNKVINKNFISFDTIVSSMRPYGLRGDVFKDTSKYGLPAMEEKYKQDYYSVIGLDNLKRTYRYIPTDYPLPIDNKSLKKWKLFVTRNWGIGSFDDMPSNPIVAGPGELCTETFVEFGPFNCSEDVENVLKYLKTKFFRTLVAIRKQDQGASKAVYHYVPLQDFTKNSDIDWTKSISEIDQQLYKKYNLEDNDIKFIETNVREME